MLESLLVRNFQKHEKRLVDFDPRLTVIVGDSDQGKTSLLRALRWVCLNKPNGTAFVRHGAKFSKVALRVDGHEIVRHRGKGRNVYALDGKQYAAFGNDVPQDIVGLLNIGEASWQGQFDAPWWLSDSAGQVSKALNRIVNLDLIDRSLENAAAELRKAKAEAEVSKERLEQADKDAEELAWVCEADAELKVVEKLEKEVEEGRERRAALAKMLGEAVEWEKVLSRARAALPVGERVLELVGEKVVLEDKRTELAASLERLEDTERERDEAKRKREKLETELKRKMKGRCPVCRKVL